MKCFHCGAEVRDGSLFCEACGREIQIVPDYNEFEEDYLKKIFLEANSPEKKKELELQEEKKRLAEEEKKIKEKKKKIVLSFAAAGGLILLFLVIFIPITLVKKAHASSYEYQLSQAENAYAENDYNSALEYYENALRLYEEDGEAFNLDIRLAMLSIYVELSDEDGILLIANEIIQHDNTNVTAYRELITLYSKNDQIDEIVALSQTSTDPTVLGLFADYIVTAPVFSLDGGTYDEYLSVTLSGAADYEIYYTIDGTDPIENGILYEDEISIQSIGTVTIKAVCKNDLGLYSEVAEEEYKIDIGAPDMPVVTPDGGNFTQDTTITVEIPEYCYCYYTWDGSVPTSESARCTGTIMLEEGNNILSVILIDTRNDLKSDVYRGMFNYTPEEVQE